MEEHLPIGSIHAHTVGKSITLTSVLHVLPFSCSIHVTSPLTGTLQQKSLSFSQIKPAIMLSLHVFVCVVDLFFFGIINNLGKL